MPVEPPQDRSPRAAWSRRAAQGSAAALAALTALGTVDAAQAAPAAPQTVHVAEQQRPDHVTVAAGDSLWSLATSHGVGVKELMAANRLPAHGMIRPGQRLVLPGTPAARQAQPTAPRTSPGAATDDAAGAPAAPRSGAAARHHSVRAGDTLWDLSQRWGVSVADLMAANSLSAGEALRPGRVLTVPGGAERQAPAASSSGTSTPRKAPAARSAVGGTFAGRSYPAEVVDSANAHHAALRQRQVPPPAQIREMVAATAREMGVDPALALAHAAQESGFRHDVVSPADAVGTMQVVPSAGQWASGMVGRDLDLLDPQDNITAGVAIIRELQHRAPSKPVGIGAYYQGLHGVTTYGMYSDTKAYVKAVSAQERKFAQ